MMNRPGPAGISEKEPSLEELQTLKEIELALKESRMLMLSLSRPDCPACRELRPRMETLLASYPRLRSVFVNVDTVEGARDRFLVEHLPTILLYSSGNETYRAARVSSPEPLAEKIALYYRILFG